jgi:hypothetical protein
MIDNRDYIVNYLMSKLAVGIYRGWFWQNYKPLEKQAALRQLYRLESVGFTYEQVVNGFSSWCLAKGVDHPPTPVDFFNFIRPVLSEAAKDSLKSIKEALNHG